ncbi:carbohydrate-binding module family 50 protein [Xylaria bambusicola]|uniref:carbohydrate-binding module family 50 protein n=1 Tax=Xylaria bambusicola TaxID=326684 RepID=UPI0020081A65|nr:carbohydrate-binding module family 50 protein [Xylaria bambusicola]KAI0528042.1 carbohydrate-binding module family 50 protein [Xylaria bambusicola]
MARWSELDTDEERLPEGMKRIGYDADSQKYTFRDADGSIWESASGNRYGQLRRVTTNASTASTSSRNEDDERTLFDDDGSTLYEIDDTKPTRPTANFTDFGLDDESAREASWRQESAREVSWRQEMRPLLNWFLLVGLFLLAVMWFISGGSKDRTEVVRSCDDGATPYMIKADDTCWAIAEARSVSLDDLLEKNKGLDCDMLSIGQTICVPAA